MKIDLETKDAYDISVEVARAKSLCTLIDGYIYSSAQGKWTVQDTDNVVLSFEILGALLDAIEIACESLDGRTTTISDASRVIIDKLERMPEQQRKVVFAFVEGLASGKDDRTNP